MYLSFFAIAIILNPQDEESQIKKGILMNRRCCKLRLTYDEITKEYLFTYSCHGGLDPTSPFGISRLLRSEIPRQARDDRGRERDF